MLRSEKQEFVATLEDVYKDSSSIIITHYHGLSVKKLSELRKSLRSNGSSFKVVKNTLVKIAAQRAGIADASSLFKGPTAIAYSADPVAAAKQVIEFANSNNNFKIIGGIVDNQLLNESQVKELAKLPSLNELRGKIIGVLQAPASKIVGVLQAPSVQLIRLLRAYANKS